MTPVEVFLDNKKINTIGPDWQQTSIPEHKTFITWLGDDTSVLQIQSSCDGVPSIFPLKKKKNEVAMTIYEEVSSANALFKAPTSIPHELKVKRI